MFIVANRKFFYALSGVLVTLALAALAVWGLTFGLDFKGGSLIEVEYAAQRPEVVEARVALSKLSLGEFSVRPTGERGFIIRTKVLDEAEHRALLAALSGEAGASVAERQYNAIGPTLSAELANKALLSLGLVLIAIVLFVTFAFRKVSEPVSSWKYGLITIAALLHDVLIPTGVFAALGSLLGGFEVDTLFVTALLVILGFSVHDTIVVFDRVRENLRRQKESGVRNPEPFEQTVGVSIRQTFNRSVNTSLTTLLAIAALFALGPESVRHFALVLLIGITAGTYSSIFIASPLLVTIEQFQRRKTKT